MKPRLSQSAIQLREQIDDAFPDRDRTSDGWIGDTRHAARKSEKAYQLAKASAEIKRDMETLPRIQQ